MGYNSYYQNKYGPYDIPPPAFPYIGTYWKLEKLGRTRTLTTTTAPTYSATHELALYCTKPEEAFDLAELLLLSFTEQERADVYKMVEGRLHPRPACAIKGCSELAPRDGAYCTPHALAVEL